MNHVQPNVPNNVNPHPNPNPGVGSTAQRVGNVIDKVRDRLTENECLHLKELMAEGYKAVDKQDVSFQGQIVSKVTLIKNQGESTGKKVLRVAGGVIMGVTMPPALLSKTVRDEAFVSPFADGIEKTLYFEKHETPQEIAEKKRTERELLKMQLTNGNEISYDPENSASIAAFVKALRNDPNLKEKVREMHDGSFVFIEKRRNGISAFLLIPKGDYNKATSMRYWGKDGGPITDPAQQSLFIQVYLAGRPEIEAYCDKKSAEWAKKAGEKAGRSEEYIEKLRKATRQELAGMKINFSARKGRWNFGSNDLNNLGKNRRLGAFFEQKTHNTMEGFYKMTSKYPLDGETNSAAAAA